jgi:ferredoxin
MGKLIYLKDVVTLALDPARCNGCGNCLEVCPHAVFAADGRKVAIVERDACMECGACARNCPRGAIKVRASVGCAVAVINSALGRTSSSCCCAIGPDGESSPGDCC